MQTRGNALVMQKNLPWIVISRSRTPSLVLNRVSVFRRLPRRGNPAHQLIWKKSLQMLRPPISATFALLHGRRSEVKSPKKDRRRFPGHYLTIGSCPGYTRILPNQGWTQHSGWSDFIQQQDCYPITTKSTNPRHTAFCSSRCLLHDVQGWLWCLLDGHYADYCKLEIPVPVMQRACAQSTTWPPARGSGTSLPLPVHLCGLL